MNWQPLDYIVALFSLVICLLLTAVIYDIVIQSKQLTDDGLERVGAVATAVVAIVSMYVGAKISQGKGNNGKDNG